MRSASAGAFRRLVLFLLLVVLTVSTVYAAEQELNPPPEARIRPPGGVSSQSDPNILDLLTDWVWLYARIRPPVG